MGQSLRRPAALCSHAASRQQRNGKFRAESVPTALTPGAVSAASAQRPQRQRRRLIQILRQLRRAPVTVRAERVVQSKRYRDAPFDLFEAESVNFLRGVRQRGTSLSWQRRFLQPAKNRRLVQNDAVENVSVPVLGDEGDERRGVNSSERII